VADVLLGTIYPASGRAATVVQSAGTVTNSATTTEAGMHDASDTTKECGTVVGDGGDCGEGSVALQYQMGACPAGTISFLRYIGRSKRSGNEPDGAYIAVCVDDDPIVGSTHDPGTSWAAWQKDLAVDEHGAAWVKAHADAVKHGYLMYALTSGVDDSIVMWESEFYIEVWGVLAAQNATLGPAATATAGLSVTKAAGAVGAVLATATPATTAPASTHSSPANVVVGPATPAAAGVGFVISGSCNATLITAEGVTAGGLGDPLSVRAYPDAGYFTANAETTPAGLSLVGSVGIRSLGHPYFAAGMRTAINEGVSGTSEEQTMRVVFSVNKRPKMLSSMSEPHYFASWHEVGGAELFSIGITPDLRLCAKTYSWPLLLSAPGAIEADGSIHEVELYCPGGGSRKLSLDGATIVDDMTPDPTALGNGITSPTALPIRFMAFNGVAGRTRCDMTILAVSFSGENQPIYWPFSEGAGGTVYGGETEGTSIGEVPVWDTENPDHPGQDWALTPGRYVPSDVPWGSPSSAPASSLWTWLNSTRFRRRTLPTGTFRPRGMSGSDYRPDEMPGSGYTPT